MQPPLASFLLLMAPPIADSSPFLLLMMPLIADASAFQPPILLCFLMFRYIVDFMPCGSVFDGFCV